MARWKLHDVKGKDRCDLQTVFYIYIFPLVAEFDCILVGISSLKLYHFINFYRIAEKQDTSSSSIFSPMAEPVHTSSN